MSSLEDHCQTILRRVLREELARLRSELEPTLNGRRDCSNCNGSEGSTDDLVSIADAANFVSVRQETIRRWVHAGKLRRFNAGRCMRVSKQDLISYLARASDHEEAFDEGAQAERIFNNIKK